MFVVSSRSRRRIFGSLSQRPRSAVERSDWWRYPASRYQRRLRGRRNRRSTCFRGGQDTWQIDLGFHLGQRPSLRTPALLLASDASAERRLLRRDSSSADTEGSWQYWVGVNNRFRCTSSFRRPNIACSVAILTRPPCKAVASNA